MRILSATALRQEVMACEVCQSGPVMCDWHAEQVALKSGEQVTMAVLSEQHFPAMLANIERSTELARIRFRV